MNILSSEETINYINFYVYRIDELESGAISITVATVSFNNNEFHNVRNNAITFDKLNNIIIDFNSFQTLESSALSVKFTAPFREFSFSNNRLHDVDDNSLNFFASIPQNTKITRINNNFFQEKCRCNLDTWLTKVIGNKGAMTWALRSSNCIVDNLLQGCFSLPEGHLSIENYTKSVCSKNLHINCSKIESNVNPSSSPPSIGPHVYPRHKGYFDVEMSNPDELAQEKRIIIIACVGAVIIIVIVIMTSGVLYVRKRGVCSKLSSGINNSWFSPTSGMTAATSARSISRLSVQEYTGFQPHPRPVNAENQSETTHLEEVTESQNAESMYVYTENKATQTLPEQLTEEYLKELQIKLNNPDQFSEARNMIEHLYDLINVEESCNNNNEQRQTSSQCADNNAYDIIRPRLKRHKNSTVPSVTIGTKIPSLDKLVPQTMKNRPQIVEYSEPRDRKYNDQNHLYAELPADDTMPSTSKLAKQPPSLFGTASTSHYAETDITVRLPEIGNDYLAVQKADSCDTTAKGHTRSLNFLKSFSGNILGGYKTNNMNGKRSNSLLFEFADTDDSTHLYSELKDPQLPTTSKMANRPLPTKPDQDAECIEPLAGL